MEVSRSCAVYWAKQHENSRSCTGGAVGGSTGVRAIRYTHPVGSNSTTCRTGAEHARADNARANIDARQRCWDAVDDDNTRRGKAATAAEREEERARAR